MQDENAIVLDARNDYEFDLGHFRGAIKPEITNFRELPDWVHKIKKCSKAKNPNVLHRRYPM